MPTIGETLREARMRQHLDIADVEDRTKIRAKYLRALENEEFGMLPGPTFVKTFLRTYAELLGLDPHLLLEEYRTTHEPGDELDQLQTLGPPGVGRERRRGRPPGPLAIVAVLALGVVVFFTVLGLLLGDDDGGGERRTADKATDGRAERRPTRERRERPRPSLVRLRVTPTTPTYVCVDTGAGTEITFEGILESARTFRGRRLRVNLGKTAVDLRANGEPVQVPGGPNPVGFEFTPTSTEPLPSGERPCA
jgi:cytoskeleton protein RodZ